MKRKIIIGKTYKHFKGNSYKVIDIVNDSNDINKKIVIYQALYGDNLKWARDYDEFNSFVDKVKYPNVEQEYRFESVEEND